MAEVYRAAARARALSVDGDESRCFHQEMMKARLPSLLLVVLLAGCVHATFVKTDASFVPHDRTAPAVFLDRLPPFPYRPVGIIEVTSPANSRLDDVLYAAAEKGAEMGCDVVVDRSIHRVADADALTGLFQRAQYGAAPMYFYAAPPPNRREFVCGISVASAPARPAGAGI
jgi:hypothetical protein